MFLKCLIGTLHTPTCKCKQECTPTCPQGSTLLPPSAICLHISEPTCPPGAELQDCKCVREVPRECRFGELSEDRCHCISSTTPVCFGHLCSLNTKYCTCEKIVCFSTQDCTGLAVRRQSKCCTGPGNDGSFHIGNGVCQAW